MGASDYSPILDQIGKTILQNKGTFYLKRPASNKDEMFVAIVKGDGSRNIVPQDEYEISGNVLKITNLTTILNMRSDDGFIINYQPSKAY